MFERLESIEKTYEELTQQMTDPSVISDQTLYTKVSRQRRELEPFVEKYRALKKLDVDLTGTREILGETSDPEMRQLAELELADLEQKRADTEAELKVLLLPKDPNDEK